MLGRVIVVVMVTSMISMCLIMVIITVPCYTHPRGFFYPGSEHYKLDLGFFHHAPQWRPVTYSATAAILARPVSLRYVKNDDAYSKDVSLSEENVPPKSSG